MCKIIFESKGLKIWSFDNKGDMEFCIGSWADEVGVNIPKYEVKQLIQILTKELKDMQKDNLKNEHPTDANNVLSAVFGEIGCYVKMRGSRNKHQVIADEHIGNHLPNCVTVIELSNGEETNTTWSRLSEWFVK